MEKRKKISYELYETKQYSRHKETIAPDRTKHFCNGDTETPDHFRQQNKNLKHNYGLRIHKQRRVRKKTTATQENYR